MSLFKVGLTRDLLTASGQPSFGSGPLDVLEKAGDVLQWEYIRESVTEITPDVASRYDAIYVNAPKVTAASVARSDCRLALIARHGVGYDSVDIPAMTRAGVLVTNTPIAVRRPVATMAITYVLALAQKMLIKDRLTRTGKWGQRNEHMGRGLTGRTLGIVGAGGTGQETLKLVRGFEMRLLAADPYADAAKVEALGAKLVPLPTLLQESDFVVLTCLLNDETRHLINTEALALMKTTAYLINVARGPVVDEPALIKVLQENRIAGAGLDVFEQEPIAPDNPLLTMDHVIVSPHALCWTDENFNAIAIDGLTSVVDVARRKRPAYLVNPDALKAPRWATCAEEAPQETTMTHPQPDRAIALCGTEQPDVVGRTLRAGPMEVEFDNGQLRYLKVGGVEVLRGIGFLVRDENWGTYAPALSKLKIDQRADSFSVSFHAVCKRHDQEIAYDAEIEGTREGNLSFTGTAVPRTEFLTARTGFVVLHPLRGVAGCPMEVEHVDGKVVSRKFPELVDPVQPVLNIRSLTHEVMPGLKATVRMEGETFEMEDHRNWTDASFKTYVRPLALPWPYRLKAGEIVRQAIKITLSGTAASTHGPGGSSGIDIKLGDVSQQTLPPLGLGMPAEEIEHSVRQLELLKLASPRFLICHFDPRRKHGADQLNGYRNLCEQSGAQCVLEVVVESVDDYAQELRELALAVKQSGLGLAAIAVCPVGDLKSVLPGDARPPAPPLPDLYRVARDTFPGIKLGGGMFSFFTELNRKRVPAQLLDFVHNTTCGIVHAADDRSVMETLEALPYQVTTARSFIGATAYRIGPSGIGCRDNPHGATWTPNPANMRICLTKLDPRQRGLFAAAWTLGYVATLARAKVDAISLGAATGPLGIIYRKSEHKQPWYDGLKGSAVFPAFHVISGLAHGVGQKMVDVGCSDSQKVQGLAYRGAKGVTLWLANLTADKQVVNLAGIKGASFVGMLDEASFVKASTDPRGFQATYAPLKGKSVTLSSYAVTFLSNND